MRQSWYPAFGASKGRRKALGVSGDEFRVSCEAKSELARGRPAQAAGEGGKDLGEDLQQHLEALISFFFFFFSC